MNNKNKNYRVMKFLEPVNKTDKAKGYVRMDIRGIRGTIMVTVEDVGDNKTTSEVYLFKDKNDKIKVGTVNSKKGMIKKNMAVGNYVSPIEKYNVCAIVRDNKIVLYAPLFSEVTPSDIKKLESVVQAESLTTEPLKQQNQMDEVAGAIESTESTESIKITEVDEVTRSAKANVNDKSERIAEEQIDKEQKNPNVPENDDIYELNQTDDEASDNEVSYDESEISNQRESIEQAEQIQDQEDDDINVSQNRNDDEEAIKQVSNKNSRNRHKNSFEENLYNVLDRYEEISPLSVDIKDLAWWKITSDDRGNGKGYLPYYNQIISSYYPYPMANRVVTCHALMRKYGYYIFGVYKENSNIKRFVYGVPGEFRREEQPYKGTTGFKNWSYKNKELDGDHGFWLAFVDARTGDVTEPPQIDLG